MTSKSTDQPFNQPTNEETKKRRWRPTRRGFLIGTGIVGGGLALGFVYGVPALRLVAANALNGSAGPGGATNEPTAWFEISPDNRVRLYVPKVEMGQGIHTAIAQVGAEELGIPWERLDVQQASTHVGPADSFGTGASNSISSTYQPLREAGAMLRAMLIGEAAVALAQPVTALEAVDGGVQMVSDPSQRLTYGEIVARNPAWDVPDEIPALKAVTDFTVIGQPKPRLDIPAKVTGQAIYGLDMRMEGMLYGAVARPSTIEGKLVSASEGTAMQTDGVVQVVIKDGFAGVVATSRAAARLGVNRLDLTWDEGKLWQQDEIEALVAIGEKGGVTVQKEGNAPKILADGISHSAEYFTPIAAHASLEPQAALAHVEADKARVWASTQAQNSTAGNVAEALGFKAEQVEVIPTFLGGGFGRKSVSDAAREAAILSQAAGVPVHVGWDRKEEMRSGYFRPPVRNKLYASLDESGKITAMEHRQASGDVLFAFFPEIAASVLGVDFGAWRGAAIHYGAIANRRTVAWRTNVPVSTASWRGLGLMPNTFALESFIDELAHLAGQDPLAFRLAHLGDEFNDRRMAAVLQAAADLAGWGTPVAAGRARGIACAIDVDTVVAQVAEVSVGEDGRPIVHRISAAMDCGLTINPDGAVAQVQGNIIWGIGSALLEEITVRDGQVVAANFDTYPLLTMKEAPQIDVVLLEAGDGIPRGVGEPAIGPTAAAMANALFALTGTRVRRLPMTAERVKG